ncbi:hypothetical protein BD311DRAFT_2387 [Dichomitus squalens]|uniref:Uncharacterized protein n=1 Tax=Dichomitus squalens TaxID=114155 RepID=A0A4V2K9U5_9APHY|nr:hypothetical protein BD311DRAFT_2387 [Dichomitus squalens]TBU65278.1 hypothetical protein BD310DRAFT_1297 [Dichomitus squalens]
MARPSPPCLSRPSTGRSKAQEPPGGCESPVGYRRRWRGAMGFASMPFYSSSLLSLAFAPCALIFYSCIIICSIFHKSRSPRHSFSPSQACVALYFYLHVYLLASSSSQFPDSQS